ncbi:MAG: hypothetical protein M3419_08525 [Actinomycetota bacterium]|nr:hypothetical protein [Actinomycetota bacterium]
MGIEEARRNLGGSSPDVVHSSLVTELEARGLSGDTSMMEQAARDISGHRSHPLAGEAAEQP